MLRKHQIGDVPMNFSHAPCLADATRNMVLNANHAINEDAAIAETFLFVCNFFRLYLTRCYR